MSTQPSTESPASVWAIPEPSMPDWFLHFKDKPSLKDSPLYHTDAEFQLSLVVFGSDEDEVVALKIEVPRTNQLQLPNVTLMHSQNVASTQFYDPVRIQNDHWIQSDSGAIAYIFNHQLTSPGRHSHPTRTIRICTIYCTFREILTVIGTYPYQIESRQGMGLDLPAESSLLRIGWAVMCAEGLYGKYEVMEEGQAEDPMAEGWERWTDYYYRYEDGIAEEDEEESVAPAEPDFDFDSYDPISWERDQLDQRRPKPAQPPKRKKREDGKAKKAKKARKGRETRETAALAEVTPADAETTDAEPAAAEPATAEPATAESATAESATAESAIADPVAAEPATVESAADEPIAVDPADIGPTDRVPESAMSTPSLTSDSSSSIGSPRSIGTPVERSSSGTLSSTAEAAWPEHPDDEDMKFQHRPCLDFGLGIHFVHGWSKEKLVRQRTGSQQGSLSQDVTPFWFRVPTPRPTWRWRFGRSSKSPKTSPTAASKELQASDPATGLGNGTWHFLRLRRAH